MTAEEIDQVLEDPRETAEFAGLTYVNDAMPGIRRLKKGRGFVYLDAAGNRIQDAPTMGRIKSLVLPPAWQNVWICPDKRGHLQATGLDKMGRKQYKYHPLWVRIRNETKYHRLLQFSRSLPAIREQVQKDLRIRRLNCRKVLAIVVNLIEHSAIRIGSESYKKLYGSFGVTTLRNKHVKISGDRISIQFRGKKGVFQTILVKSRRLAKQVQRCREIPGYELFQFYDEEGKKQKIESGMVNDYLCEISGHDFTSKDFRTWAGTVYAYRSLLDYGDYQTKAEMKRNIVQAIDQVAAKLGNTRSVCKKYYVHPAILQAYEDQTLLQYAERSNPGENVRLNLSPDEKAVYDIITDYELSSGFSETLHKNQGTTTAVP